MKKILLSFSLSLCMLACSTHKNLAAQTTAMLSNQDTLIENVNRSQKDVKSIIPQVIKFQLENDLVIAFASLNYAWTRKGTYYILASKNNTWKVYSYQAKLPPTEAEAAMPLTPISVDAKTADNIKQMYTKAKLWETQGDDGKSPCTSSKNCNINDAESWAITVATPQNMHTTTYYAPDFFENCCPGDAYRKQFIGIAKEMMKLGNNQSSYPDR